MGFVMACSQFLTGTLAIGFAACMGRLSDKLKIDFIGLRIIKHNQCTNLHFKEAVIKVPEFERVTF